MTDTAFIKREAALRVVMEALEDQEVAADQARVILARVDDWLTGQRAFPKLVSASAAAALFGIKPPGIAKLRDQGRMPESIEVAGAYGVYLREDVERLARQLARERTAREQRREERASA